MNIPQPRRGSDLGQLQTVESPTMTMRTGWLVASAAWARLNSEVIRPKVITASSNLIFMILMLWRISVRRKFEFRTLPEELFWILEDHFFNRAGEMAALFHFQRRLRHGQR